MVSQARRQSWGSGLFRQSAACRKAGGGLGVLGHEVAQAVGLVLRGPEDAGPSAYQLGVQGVGVTLRSLNPSTSR